MGPSVKKWLFAVVGTGLLFVAGSRVGPLNAERREHRLVLPPPPDSMLPSRLLSPLLAVGRAPLVDYLWIRATKLKDQGLYFDAYQLSRLICDLQPKFASVWAFQAWNMSYNISVTLKSPEARWRWVRNGYELLRDKAIPLNPTNAQLYKELAWILFHKVGDMMDEWHYYYKLQFALQMEDILGEPPDGWIRRGRVRGDFYRDYDYTSLANAPLKFVELLEVPETRAFVERLKTFGFDASEPGVYLGLLASIRDDKLVMPDTPEHEQADQKAALLAYLDDPRGKSYQPLPSTFDELVGDPDISAFTEALAGFGFDASEEGVYLDLLAGLRSGELRMPGTPEEEQAERLAALRRFLADSRNRPAVETVEAFWRCYDSPDAIKDVRVVVEKFWRARRLRNEVRLDPERILKLQEIYGVTLDIRVPETQALYWASLGMEQSTDQQGILDIHRLNTNRIEFYCLQKMFHRGRIAMGPDSELGEPPLLSPDMRVVPILFEAFVRDSQEYLTFEEQDSPVSTNFQSGFIGFMRTAAMRYHELGMQEEARKMFDYLKEHFSDPMYEQGLDVFLAKQFMFDRENPDLRTAVARIRVLAASGLHRYAYDEDDYADRYLTRARQVHDRYQKNIVSERMRIPPFREILEQVAHEIGGRMYRSSYERICRKVGITPLPRAGPREGSPVPARNRR